MTRFEIDGVFHFMAAAALLARLWPARWFDDASLEQAGRAFDGHGTSGWTARA
jgi:hypothetical protein